MSLSLLEQDAIICHEMMVHVPLFSHPKPRQIAILHDLDEAFKQEAQKHPNIEQIYLVNDDEMNLLKTINTHSLDLIIATQPLENYQTCFQSLHTDGILVQQCDSPFNLEALKTAQQKLRSAGFHDAHTMQFPQPSFPSGWRAAIVTVKNGILKRPREKDIYNKTFATHYYNLDVHKSAFAMPEFMRELVEEAYGR